MGIFNKRCVHIWEPIPDTDVSGSRICVCFNCRAKIFSSKGHRTDVFNLSEKETRKRIAAFKEWEVQMTERKKVARRKVEEI